MDIVRPTLVVEVRHPEDSDLAYALSPAWSLDGALGEGTACDMSFMASFTISAVSTIVAEPMPAMIFAHWITSPVRLLQPTDLF